MANSLAVIGGGVAGCLSAIRARQAGIENVVIFEQSDGIMTAASAIVSELHCGAEYPTDILSGLACLRGAVEMTRLVPDQVFAKKTPTKFLIAQGTEREGEITVKLMRNHLELLKEEYTRLCYENPENFVLGRPEDFSREIAPEEYLGCSNIAGGFLTRQRSFDNVIFASVIREALNTLNVQVVTDSSVFDAQRLGNKFRVTGLRQEKSFTSDYDLVVVASGLAGLPLLSKLADNHYSLPTVFAALRHIAILDRSNVGIQQDGTYLTLEGAYGGMDAPITGSYGLCYVPKECQLEFQKVDSFNWRLPDSWQKLISQSPELKNEAGQKILNSATSLCYPYLKDAKVISTHTKVAVSSTGISRLRRYVEVDSPSPGCINMCFTTKATSAITSASKAVKIMLQHLVMTGQINKDEAVTRANQMSTASLDFSLKHMDSWQRVDFYNTQGNLMGHPSDSLRMHPCNGLQRDIQLPNLNRYSDGLLKKGMALVCNI